MNQNQRLRQYLLAYGHIDPLTALSQLGIYRLSARILDLRYAGLSIETKRETVPTRTGTARVARYELL